jgi:hypothetical protein
MRAQGLSIRYIVVLALAILVLVIIGLMLYRAQGSSNAINRQSAINTCRDLCVEAENIAIGAQGTPGVLDYPSASKPKFCTVTLNVDGQQKHCYELYTCTLTDAEGDSLTLDESGCNSI